MEAQRPTTTSGGGTFWFDAVYFRDIAAFLKTINEQRCPQIPRLRNSSQRIL
jgi:hypothetical protein